MRHRAGILVAVLLLVASGGAAGSRAANPADAVAGAWTGTEECTGTTQTTSAAPGKVVHGSCTSPGQASLGFSVNPTTGKVTGGADGTTIPNTFVLTVSVSGSTVSWGGSVHYPIGYSGDPKNGGRTIASHCSGHLTPTTMKVSCTYTVSGDGGLSAVAPGSTASKVVIGTNTTHFELTLTRVGSPPVTPTPTTTTTPKQKPKSASMVVDVSVDEHLKSIGVGQPVLLTVKVTAGAVPLTDIDLTLAPVGLSTASTSAVTVAPDSHPGFALAAAASRSFTFKAKASEATKVTIKVSATAKSTSGNLAASATATFLVKGSPYALNMTGLAREPKVGKLPQPISPTKVAFGDTVTFGLTGWDPDGGPIAVSWGTRSLGKLTPTDDGAAEGELKLEDFQVRGTLANPKPCAGTLTAIQGTHKAALELKSDVRGYIVLNDKTKSTLKANDAYCAGEIETHPRDFAPAGGAMIYTGAYVDAENLGSIDLKNTSSFVPIVIDDDETNIHVNSTMGSFQGRLCLRLGSKRWVVIRVPVPGEIAAIDNAAPCLPNPNPPHILAQETAMKPTGHGLATITTATVSMEKTDANEMQFPQATTFTKRIDCNETYLYGEDSLTFPKGLQGGPCAIGALGNIEILGALRLGEDPLVHLDGITLWAGGDLILWGSTP